MKALNALKPNIFSGSKKAWVKFAIIFNLNASTKILSFYVVKTCQSTEVATRAVL